MSSLCKPVSFSYGESPRTPPLEGTSLHRRNNIAEIPCGILSMFTTCLLLRVKSHYQSQYYNVTYRGINIVHLQKRKEPYGALERTEP